MHLSGLGLNLYGTWRARARGMARMGSLMQVLPPDIDLARDLTTDLKLHRSLFSLKLVSAM